MTDEPKSLAHPAWPYTGTPWEWRITHRPAPDGCFGPNGWIPPWPQQRGHLSNIGIAPQGCICPPTSEQTCKNDKCPRK